MIRSLANGLARKLGYEFRRIPSVLWGQPSKRLAMDFEFAFAHLLLHNADVFVVQIGANDGVSNDPVNKFIRDFELSAALVEPQPLVFEKLVSNYENVPGVTLHNVGIGPRKGVLPFYTVDPEQAGSDKAQQYGSFIKESVLSQTRFIPDVADHIVQIDVDTITFDDLMATSGRDKPDVIVLDTEGFDGTILRSIDIARYDPTLIAFEFVNMSKSEFDDQISALVDLGYRVSWDDLDVTAYRPKHSWGWRHALP